MQQGTSDYNECIYFLMLKDSIIHNPEASVLYLSYLLSNCTGLVIQYSYAVI